MDIYSPSFELIQSCLSSDLVIITGRHFHLEHDAFAFKLCSELINYKQIKLGIEILPTSFSDADKNEREEFYNYVKENYWFGGSGTLDRIEYLPSNVSVHGLERPPYSRSRGLINDFDYCRKFYTKEIDKDKILIEEIEKQNVNVVLVGEKHQKEVYNSFENCQVINQSCALLNHITPLRIEIENSLVIADSCKVTY